jgi:hypothetical protein
MYLYATEVTQTHKTTTIPGIEGSKQKNGIDATQSQKQEHAHSMAT